jgi:enoyl-CoA hydratase/carnithine racemase
MAAVVESNRDDGVAIVTVGNPPVNALSDDVITGLTAVAGELDHDRSVRAIILTGAGADTFIAGADLHALRDAMEVPGGIEDHLAITAPMFRAWGGLRQPVIAALAGDALGGGLELAMAADLIVADPTVSVGLPEVNLGLMPGAGGTQRLPARIGPAALRLILLGKPLGAAEAQAVGLVDLVSDAGGALDEAKRVAARLASLPALAVQNAKAATRHAIEAHLQPGLELERSLFVATSRTVDAREGVEAFLTRRRPVYSHT